MRVRILRTQGRRLRRCDQCGGSGQLQECLLPYTGKRASSGNYTGRYRDLCRACFNVISDHPLRWVTPDTDLSRSEFRRHATAYPVGVVREGQDR